MIAKKYFLNLTTKLFINKKTTKSIKIIHEIFCVENNHFIESTWRITL